MKKITLPLIVLLIAILGCSKFKELTGGPSAGGPGGGTGGGSGVSASSDPKADVIAAARKFIELKSFSAKMDGVGETDIKSQVDFVAPDKFHVKYLGGTGAGMEMINIGSDSYMKSGGGNWSKIPGTGGRSIPTMRDSFNEEGIKSLTDVKFEGEDTADGKPALVYSYKNVTPAGDHPFTAKIWIAKSSGIPVKIYAEYPNGTLKHMTVNFDIDSPVTVEAPIK